MMLTLLLLLNAADQMIMTINYEKQWDKRQKSHRELLEKESIEPEEGRMRCPFIITNNN